MFGIDLFTKWSPTSARDHLRKGNPPRRMRVAGRLDLANCGWLTDLPRVLIADSIDVSGCRRLRALPEHVECNVLRVAGTSVTRLGGQFDVTQSIDATECPLLKRVEALRVPELHLQGCTALEHLAEGLLVRQLNISGCTKLDRIPEGAAGSLWNLDASRCTSLTSLPNGLAHLQSLNVAGCARLEWLPDDIRIQSRLEIADSGLKALPHSLRSVRLLWRGMLVSDRIAFAPETITCDEVLQEQNLEYRRLLIERMGMEAFISKARAETLDKDFDPGGPRRLLRVPFENGENVVCLEVHCPSTGRKYILRVPPGTLNCAEAAAWVAGFNNPRRYRPVVET